MFLNFKCMYICAPQTLSMLEKIEREVLEKWGSAAGAKMKKTFLSKQDRGSVSQKRIFLPMEMNAIDNPCSHQSDHLLTTTCI